MTAFHAMLVMWPGRVCRVSFSWGSLSTSGHILGLTQEGQGETCSCEGGKGGRRGIRQGALMTVAGRTMYVFMRCSDDWGR